MPRFAANLTMLFTEYPVVERFDRAASAGFQAVELLFPYDEDLPAIEAALARNGLELVLFDLPVGDFVAGERGYANDPARVGEFREGVEQALEIAARLDCRLLNCLVGLSSPNIPAERQWETIVENLRFAAERTGEAGVRLLVEPLNDIGTPGFLLTTTRQAVELLDRVGHPNLSIQSDIYHMQRMEGNLTATLRQYLQRIGHIQVADSPGRNQPGTGEINYPFVFATLDELGYGGWVSLEYRPTPDTEGSLSWLRDFGYWA